MSFLDFKEKDIPVKYGMYNLCEEREAARGSLKYILSDFADIKRTYFTLGFHLDEFIRCEYYKDFGYLSFKDFAVENIPLDYSSVNRCINVFNMTCQRREDNGGVGGVKTMFMKDEYKDYSYSQLVEMVSMNSSQRKQVNSSMSVRQIRDVKTNKYNSLSGASVPVPPVPVEAPEEDDYDCDVAIDDDVFIFDFVHMLRNKFRDGEVKNLTFTKRSIWFQSKGKQYKFMFSISDVKE